MRTFGLLLITLAGVAIAGCGAGSDPKPMLQSLGALEHFIGDVLEGLEEGDVEAIDKVLHTADFGKAINDLPSQIAASGLSPDAQQKILAGVKQVLATMKIVHGPLHHGTLDGVDVEAVTADLSSAITEMTSAIPEDWTIPGFAHDHGEEGHDDHAGHAHADHEEHAGHDHDGAEHADEDGHDHDGDADHGSHDDDHGAGDHDSDDHEHAEE